MFEIIGFFYFVVFIFCNYCIIYKKTKRYGKYNYVLANKIKMTKYRKFKKANIKRKQFKVLSTKKRKKNQFWDMSMLKNSK